MANAGRIVGRGFEQVLLVGDREGAQGLLGLCLSEAGFRVQVAEDGRDALERVARQPPDLVVTNDERPRIDGIGLVRRLRETSDIPVVVLSAEGSISECEEAMRVGANRFLQSRCDLGRVGQVARELVEGGPACPEARRAPNLTASQARGLRDRELFDLLEELLFETRGNIAEMARRMGKDRSTVRYHMKRFGMLDGRQRRD
ncbi:MAG: response regulator [bacterium]|nr:response regulator [bacterium]